MKRFKKLPFSFIKIFIYFNFLCFIIKSRLLQTRLHESRKTPYCTEQRCMYAAVLLLFMAHPKLIETPLIFMFVCLYYVHICFCMKNYAMQYYFVTISNQAILLRHDSKPLKKVLQIRIIKKITHSIFVSSQINYNYNHELV